MSKRLKTEYFNLLKDSVADLYPIQNDIMDIMIRAGLRVEESDLHGSGENMWYSVLCLAEDKDKLPDLVKTAREKFPETVALQKTLLALEDGSAFITEIRYDDYVKSSTEKAAKVFLVYDENDKEIVRALKMQLTPLEKYSGIIKIFDMHAEPVAGIDRNKFLLEKLGESQVVMLLLTPNFMGNPENNCDPLAFGSMEMRKCVIPVLLEQCLWKRIELFKNIVPLPKDGIFVSESTNRNRTLTEIANGLVEAISKNK